MDATNPQSRELRIAQTASHRYAEEFALPVDQQRQLFEPPLFGPVTVERDTKSLIAFRWLGGGRGAAYLQAEIDVAHRTVQVYYGTAGIDLPSRIYEVADLEEN